MRRRHLFLILPLLLLVALPLVATAVEDHEDRVLRSRSEDGRDRIIIRSGGRTEAFDMDALEDALESLDHLDIDIEELVEEALEGLDDLEIDFGSGFVGDWDHGHGEYDFDFDEESLAELEERMERWGEEFSRRMEHKFGDDFRGRVRVRDAGWHSDDDDDREALEDELRDLRRQVRRLQAELDDLRGGDDGDS